MAIALVLTVVLARVAPPALHGTDAACYANIARTLSTQPLTAWADVRWLDDQVFYEHPPLGLWLEGAWLSVFGATATAAVAWARVLALVLALLVGALGFRLSGVDGAAASLVGLASLASFQREAENPMLELPLAVACAAALLACEALARPGKRALIAFALCAIAAFWIKGVVSFALVGGLAWAAWRGASLRRVLAAAAAALGLLAVTVAGFELVRALAGLPAYFPAYLMKHVAVAFADGRHTTETNPLFHVKTLLDWHLVPLLALPVIAVRWRATPQMRPFAVLGVAWLLCVLIPFSLAKQKSPWHLNVLMPGDALLVAGALLCLPRVAWRLFTPALVVWMVGWVVQEFRAAARPSSRQVAVLTLARLPAPPPQSTVQNCSVLDPWLAQHLFAFHWQARWVPCDGDARWRFDGVELRQTE